MVAQREKGESDALRSRDVELARAQSLESLLESTREELESVNAAAVDAADKYEATIAQLQEEAEHARALEAHTAERLQVTHATIVDFKHKLAALSSDTARLLTRYAPHAPTVRTCFRKHACGLVCTRVCGS
ncbi:hypothetical protein EON66_05800, partial [archaeon]